MNYDGKSFIAVSSSTNSEVSPETIFHYQQRGKVLSCNYTGHKIKQGSLIGLVDDLGCIDMRYQQINLNDELKTGICNSRPELLANGKIRLHETWKWTSGDLSEGESVLEEI